MSRFCFTSKHETAYAMCRTCCARASPAVGSGTHLETMVRARPKMQEAKNGTRSFSRGVRSATVTTTTTGQGSCNPPDKKKPRYQPQPDPNPQPHPRTVGHIIGWLGRTHTRRARQLVRQSIHVGRRLCPSTRRRNGLCLSRQGLSQISHRINCLVSFFFVSPTRQSQTRDTPTRARAQRRRTLVFVGACLLCWFALANLALVTTCHRFRWW